MVVFPRKVCANTEDNFLAATWRNQESKLSDPIQKLQRLLAQQRALSAQIKTLEDRERAREAKVISLLIRRHKLTRFTVEQLNEALTRMVAEIEFGTMKHGRQPEGMGQTSVG